ncbi:MAG: NADH oxidoreductase (quinone) subunit F [Bdellovibrionales bacterium RIFOXYC1_FULL_54_43]|nr:MAG: NADH oxidoreductase (quinone) subunit F [Bdellovibrionales bacterium RIFOXYC1_FULL_54_43]OFZ78848.1 MAG: NADH oxidoreductase (quinone) subunit F [Bdellovibrionales bacterium RIFOXYD1_FULL_55_31]
MSEQERPPEQPFEDSQPETLFIQHFCEEARPLSYYLKNMSGYSALKKALGMSSDEVINEVKKAHIRGRGGAGFPAGVKWSLIPKESAKAKYFICNADESEPGTFKDRDLMRYTPHLVLEGMAIGAYAIGAHTGYIYIRGEYVRETGILQAAILEAEKAGYLGKNIMGTGFDFEITIHRGAGAYICGEETALLNSLEGRRGEPRVKPPYPAIAGAFGGPTVVNNVETLAGVPFVLNRGGDWYAKLGRITNSGGTRIYEVSGHVKKPGLYELDSGSVTVRQLIYDYCHGILDDKKLKAVIPGGSSAPVLRADEIDVVADIDPMLKIGSMLGSAGMIVVSEDYCLVRLLARIVRFYAHESCGQCTPCREGTKWAQDILDRIEGGRGHQQDLGLILQVADNMNAKSLCALADAAAGPIISFVTKFRADFEAHIRGGKCPHA